LRFAVFLDAPRTAAAPEVRVPGQKVGRKGRLAGPTGGDHAASSHGRVAGRAPRQVWARAPKSPPCALCSHEMGDVGKGWKREKSGGRRGPGTGALVCRVRGLTGASVDDP
jgi:hypothetical protein